MRVGGMFLKDLIYKSGWLVQLLFPMINPTERRRKSSMAGFNSGTYVAIMLSVT